MKAFKAFKAKELVDRMSINKIHPPEELPGLRIILVFLVLMTIGDVVFLWNSFSVASDNPLLSVPMTVSLSVATLCVPMLCASLVGACFDDDGEGGERAQRVRIALIVGLIVAFILLVVFVTFLRLGTIDLINAAGASGQSAGYGQASFGAEGQSSSSSYKKEVGDSEALLVAIMTAMLLATGITAFGYKLVDSCITVRTPMVEAARQRYAVTTLAKIDAIRAGIEARDVNAVREEDEGNRVAAAEALRMRAHEAIVGIEASVAVDQGDPAAIPVAVKDWTQDGIVGSFGLMEPAMCESAAAEDALDEGNPQKLTVSPSRAGVQAEGAQGRVA